MNREMGREPSWAKVLTIIGALGVPLVSVVVWLIVAGTHLVDQVNVITINQAEQSVRMQNIESNVKDLSSQVETLSTNQKLNKQDIDNKFLLLKRK